MVCGLLSAYCIVFDKLSYIDVSIMQEFEKLIRLYYAGLVVTELSTRSGTKETHEKDLWGVSGFLAWQTLVSAKVMLGVEPIAATFVCDQDKMNIVAKDGIEILDSESCLKALSWVLCEYEDGDLSEIDDHVTSLLSNYSGVLHVQPDVNTGLMALYEETLAWWQVERGNELVRVSGVEPMQGKGL